MSLNVSQENSSNTSSNVSATDATTGITDTFYISLFFIQIPGIVTNFICIICIVSESRRTKMPTNFLLLMLCITDFLAVCTTCLWHNMARFGYIDTYTICSFKVYTQAFCPAFSGLVSFFMAIDRALAFCTPFFYRTHINKRKWSIVCFIGFVVLSSICLLPHAGLGTMWNKSTKTNTYKCSAFRFPDEPKKRVFLIVFGTLGIILQVAVVSSNTFVMAAVLRLRKRTEEAKKSAGSGIAPRSTEIRFAVIVGVLACVFIICWAPYNMWIMFTLFHISMSNSTKGTIHRLAGVSFTADPFVYLIIRKSNRQFLRRVMCYFRCCARKEEMMVLNSASTLDASESTQQTLKSKSTTDM